MSKVKNFIKPWDPNMSERQELYQTLGSKHVKSQELYQTLGSKHVKSQELYQTLGSILIITISEQSCLC
jgi:hypothetical protein